MAVPAISDQISHFLVWIIHTTEGSHLPMPLHGVLFGLMYMLTFAKQERSQHTHSNIHIAGYQRTLLFKEA